MIRIISILLFVCCFTPCFSQINMFQSLEERYMLDLDRESFPKLSFNWNFDGRVQGAVNAGLTELLDNKDYEKAIGHFSEAISRMPECVPALYYRGVCQKVLDKLDSARQDLSTATHLAPKDADILLELAELHEIKWEYKEAEKLYEKALELNPAFAAAYFNLGNLSMRQGAYAKAIRHFKKSIEINPELIEAHVRQGILAYTLDKKGSRTIPHFNSALAIDSTYQAALFWRGMMYLRDKNVEKCLENWTKLVDYNPEQPVFVMLRAFLYLDLKNYEDAFIDLKKVFSRQYEDENSFRGVQSTKDKQVDLQFAVAYITRTIYGLDDQPGKHVKNGFCFMVMERSKDAIAEFNSSLRQQPSALALFLRAMTYEHVGKHDSAFYSYGEALQYDKDIFDAHKKRAIYFSELKDWKNAYAHFEEMIRLEPQLTVTYRLRSMIRINFKDYYGAMMDLTKLLAIDSSDHEIYLYRAYCEKAVKDLKNENRDYRKALEMQPDRYQLYQNVIDSDLELKDTSHALETIAACEKAFGLQTYLVSTRVRIFVEQKKYDVAREEINKALGNESWMTMVEQSANSVLYYLDGWVDYLSNNKETALRKLNKALTHNERNFEALYLRSKLFVERGEKARAIRDLKTLAGVGYGDAEVLLNQLR